MAREPKDTIFPKINQQSFLAGEAIDYKLGVAGSADSLEAMDFRSKASQMTVLPGMTTLSSSNVLVDKITAMDQDISGIRYGLGDQGNFYKIDGTNTITKIGTLDSNGAAGCAYSVQTDQVYLASQQSISLYGQTQNTNTSPTLKIRQFGKSASVSPAVIYIFNTSTNSWDGNTDTNTSLTTQRNNLASLAGTGVTSTANVTNTLTNTYTLPSSISESATNLCSFVPDLTPFYSVSVYITTIGSGNLTLTMHDAQNNVLGTSTINHASVTTGFNEFVFAAPGITVIPNNVVSTAGSAYHFHLTSSVSSDTAAVATIASNNLSGVNMVLFAYRMVKTQNGWHPMMFFNGQLLIGNGMYVSTYNGGNDSAPSNAQYVRHRVVLDDGYECTSITGSNQYAVICAGRTSNTLGRSYQGGFIYLWDGINYKWNIRVPVPMGTPYSAYCTNNVVYFYCNGSLFAYAPGGTSIIKVRYMDIQNSDYLGTYEHTVVNPNMMDTRYNLLLMGYPSMTTNTNTRYGIYTWGSVELSYPNGFGYSYRSANGYKYNTSTLNLQIGMIKNFVDNLYMSWQYTDSSSVVHYGLDISTNSSVPATNSSWSSLIWDGGTRYHVKKGLRVKITFLPLPAGWTLTGWYSLDRGAQISADPYGSNLPYSASTGATSILINLPNGRFTEAQWGYTAVNNSATEPYVITGIAAEIDALEDEDALRLDTLG